MTTTDHAIVAPAVTGDPGTRADAGGFDPGKPFRTRDGRSAVIDVVCGPGGGDELLGFIGSRPRVWSFSGHAGGEDETLADDLVNYDPAAPDPILQPGGDAPPAPSGNYPEIPDSSISRQDAIASQERYLEQIRNDPLGIDPVMIALAERKLAQMRSDAPPAPAQSAGAAADDEDDAALISRIRHAADMLDKHVHSRESAYGDANLLWADLHAAADALARRGARPNAPASPSPDQLEAFARGLMDLDGRGHLADVTGDVFDSGRPMDQPAWRSYLARGEQVRALCERVFGAARGEVAEAVLAERERWMPALEALQNIVGEVRTIDNMDYATMAGEALKHIRTPAAVLDRARPDGQGSKRPVVTHVYTVSDETIAYLEEMKQRLGLTKNTDVLRHIVEEAQRQSATPPSAAAAPPVREPWNDGREPREAALARYGRMSAAPIVTQAERVAAHKAFRAHVRPDSTAEAGVDAALEAASAARRATSAPAQDAGPAGVTEPEFNAAVAEMGWAGRPELEDAVRGILKAAARARTPDAGKEPGR